MSFAADAPRVSVFVQAYNSEPYVAECVASVLAQTTRFRLEVIVIDDASPDGTAAIVEGVRDPRVRFIRHEKNRGAIATANEGYALASGDYVVRLDSDDRLRPAFLERAASVLEAHPNVGVVYGNVVTIDSRGAVTSQGGVVHREPAAAAIGDEFFPLLLSNYVPAPATMVRRSALQRLLPIPAHYRFLDWYITTGIAERCDACFIDEVLADYRIHETNMHRAMVRDRTGEETSRAILDALFESPFRRDEKRVWRRRVYAQHFLTYADKYFGAGMSADARRCYLAALRLQPARAFDPGTARRLAATIVGQSLYEAAKARVAASRTT